MPCRSSYTIRKVISGKDLARLELSRVKKTDIPWEISRSDGTVSENQHEVLCHWKCAFEKLLNPECGTFQIQGMSGPDRISIDTLSLDTEIIVDEVRYALHRAEKAKQLVTMGYLWKF